MSNDYLELHISCVNYYLRDFAREPGRFTHSTILTYKP